MLNGWTVRTAVGRTLDIYPSLTDDPAGLKLGKGAEAETRYTTKLGRR
jgi:hypothetical protein